MGWTVLYIAFGIVALWLLGEVLLQYKARLRWRLLAFAGFGIVVVGVLMPSVFVIVLGTIAFATGQTYVTLSFRRGFSTGWAIGGNPGESRRRRGGGDREGRGPTLQVSDLEMAYDEGSPQPAAPGAPAAAVYEPEPMPDDTGQYGVYSDHHRSQPEQGPQEQPQPQYAAYEPYADPAPYGSPGQDTYAGPDTYAGQDPLAGQYDYGNDRQQYAAYSDPYIGTGTTGGAPQYDAYDSGYDSFGGRQEYTPDPYAQQYAPDTPPGGVWVPQQREGEQYPVAPPEPPAQPAPYPNGYNNGNGYDEQQYRY
ncbi:MULTISPECIES: hypothetical protein [unclassified Streptomyces]|uniref:hypothetical protein n=1 Tax=unclassified Streptomyces TaxID=2593676 RepID=UPI00224F6F7D|nr:MULTISPECIES: hypothetical protein [unclassified Streptomyces]MCX4397202.1 hypothetical protein [Streptomyces sp. NBC_01767]WSC30734.1 hypothetical protein OG902_30840 [Streptomyces sp. NBC_01768]WSG50308.1 hypothetical protein OHA38_11145 [Streptomyces sp. NBC_01732]WSP49575.1 hypothetical protein OG348_29045 [Streptomyces sp. NBC_01243]